ncbi:MAG: PGPGW domain-containing protein [Brooklawnia sp.]|jgi:hypothetical protein
MTDTARSHRVAVNGATRVPHEPPDRLAWRAQLRSTPTGRLWLRIGVGVLGAALVIAAPLTGWLPGPGGIPLFLAGMALLSTEFIWAKNSKRWLMRRLATYLSWTPHQQRLFWAGFFVVLGILWWIGLVALGVPDWVPHQLGQFLVYLPGVG